MFYVNIFKQPQYRLIFIFSRLLASVLILIVPRFCFEGTTMEITLIICFSQVIPTINFQRLKILLVTLLVFIVEYIFLKQFVKLLIVKYTYLLTQFRRLRAIVGFVGLVPSCYPVFMGISQVQNFFLCLFRGSIKIFLVGIQWVSNFFSQEFRNFFLWVFCGSKVFSCDYFVGPKYFPVGVSWVQFYFF